MKIELYVGSEVYNVCAGLELNSVGMKVGVVVCRQQCIVNSYGKYCRTTAVDLSGLLGSPGRARWLHKR